MRVLLVFLLLTVVALARPAFEVLDTTYRDAAQKAFEYGNYVACDRLVAELIKLYEGLRDHPKLKGREDLRAQMQQEIRKLEVGRVFVLGAARFYSDALRQGRALYAAPDLTPELRLQAALATLIAASRGQQPRVVDELLQPATRLAQEQRHQLALFTLRSLADFRLFQQRSREDKEMWAGLTASWDHLKGFRPNPKPELLEGDALTFLEGERWWNNLLVSYSLTNDDPRWGKLYDAETDRVEAVVEKTRRIDWWLGYLNAWLEDVEVCQLAGDYAQAGELLEYAEQQFVKPYYERTRKLEAAHRKACRRDQATVAALAASTQKEGLPALDTRPLDYSLLAGSVSLIRARQLVVRAALILDVAHDKPDKAQIARLTSILDEALALQKLGSQGHFLGAADVRWVQLRAGVADMVTAKQLLIESEVQGYRPGMVGAYSYQGFRLAYEGLKAEAVEKLKKAVALEEQYLAETGADEQSLAELRADWQKTYDLLTRLQLELGDAQGAYSTLGRRQQLDTLPSTPEVTNLRGQAAALEQEIIAKRAAGQDSKPVEELLAKTRGEYNTVIARLRQENPRYASMLAIRPVSFAQQQGSIPLDTAIVQYFPAGDSLYFFVATREDLKIRQLKVNDAVLTDEVRAFRVAVRDRKPTSERLHQLLIDPVEADLANKPVVAFIPTGVLTYLPFGALNQGGKYLVSRKQCVTLLKSADLDRLGQPANTRRDGLLALGNPDGTLPAAEKEATDVATLFGTRALVGQAATAASLAAAGPVAYVHLATHGVLNPRDPTASYVLLASGPLPVEGIYNLKLDGVRLVTLSACQTALGEVNPGSELTTLADAFATAGANAVVASLWSVDDRATEDLMTEFYRRLKAGENLAHALQGAQLKLLEAGRPPFFWAPFVLIGDWR